ncbi:MAG TPA: Gfo/Idh/MocA family oxidoreductase [Gemmataceae bacterium]|nr:Gfo/Idh/MocA family oxidoreductase [Gemmataceae bacterium]
MNAHEDRRDFLKAAALAGAGFWVAGGVEAASSQAANDRLNFACIGVGGKGRSDTADAASHGNVVAICDVDDGTLAKSAALYPKARRFNDFRRMFDTLGKSIDAVTVSTADHTHAVASALAMRLGKHCHTQKPLTHSIHEARRLAEIARERKVATQMGNQGTASAALRRAAAIIRAGTLGAVREVHVWTDRPGKYWEQGLARPAQAAVPKALHWDLWLGPVAARPYGVGYHPFRWRGFWDFGTGALGDMGCHNLNMAFMGLDLRDPIAVEAETSGHNKESYPRWSIVRYTFAERNSRPRLTLTWYDGGRRPAAELAPGQDLGSNGSLVIGAKGKLLFSRGYKLLGDVEEPRVKVTESPGHFAEFVRAIRGGPAAMSNFPDYAGPLTETVLLGNLAIWAGKRIEWDARKLRATNAAEVAPLIQPTYRKGYSL